jgi:uncharacterized protein with HEPN domain
MLEAARDAAKFVSDRSRSDLDSDRMLSFALIRLLEIVGEAARGISPALRAAHPEIPWARVAGMRDRLIHGYFDVNLDVVWETITRDLPELAAKVERIAAGHLE